MKFPLSQAVYMGGIFQSTFSTFQSLALLWETKMMLLRPKDKPRSGTCILKVMKNYLLISEKLFAWSECRCNASEKTMVQINNVFIGLVNWCIAMGLTNIHF